MREWWCKTFHKAHHICMTWVYDNADDTHWHCSKCGRDWHER